MPRSLQLITVAVIFYLSAVATCNADRSLPLVVSTSVNVSDSPTESPVQAEHKGHGSESESESEGSSVSSSTDPHAQNCPNGLTCDGGNITGYCPLGHWCEQGVASPCPSGNYGENYGLPSSSCSGRCDFMWTGGEGAIVCDQFSIDGILIILAIACASIGTIFLAILVSQKAIHSKSKLYPLKNVFLSEEMKVAMLVEARTTKQHQIRDHVAILVSNIMKHAFPSSFFLSSSLVQRGIVPPEQVNASIEAVRQELTDHMITSFLLHPFIQFNDETYPLNLPDWFGLSLASPIGEQRVFELAKSFATGIKPAVEQDIMEWFQRQQRQQQSQQQQRLHVVEQPDASHESKQALLDETSFNATGSLWPCVDRDLKIVMRVSLVPQYNDPILSDLRVDYGSGTTPKKYCNNFFWVPFIAIFDMLMVVASFACIIGSRLITLNVAGTTLASASYSNLNISQASLDISWYPRQVQVNLDLFPVMRECTNLYGPIYFTLHLIAFACFCICGFSSLVQLCSVVSRSSLLCRSCSRNTRTDWKRRTQSSRSYAWLMDQRVTDICRCIGFIVTLGAVAVYFPGCVVRLSRTSPAAVIAFETINDRYDPYGLIPPRTTLDFHLEVIVQASLFLSVASVVGTLIPASIGYVRICERSNAQQEASNIASLDGLTTALILPSSSVDSSNVSSDHVYQPPGTASTGTKSPPSYQGAE